MSQPHFGLSVRVKPTLPKVGNLESSETPENLNLKLKAKTTCIGVFLVSLERS
jgi:hypothetical protein